MGMPHLMIEFKQGGGTVVPLTDKDKVFVVIDGQTREIFLGTIDQVRQDWEIVEDRWNDKDRYPDDAWVPIPDAKEDIDHLVEWCELMHKEIVEKSMASTEALDMLWRDLTLSKNPDYGDWDYPAQAYRHIMDELKDRGVLDASKGAGGQTVDKTNQELKQRIAELENELGRLPEDCSVDEVMERLHQLEGLKNSLSHALKSIASIPLLSEPEGAYYGWKYVGKFFDINISLARAVCDAFDFEYQVSDFRDDGGGGQKG